MRTSQRPEPGLRPGAGNLLVGIHVAAGAVAGGALMVALQLDDGSDLADAAFPGAGSLLAGAFLGLCAGLGAQLILFVLTRQHRALWVRVAGCALGSGAVAVLLPTAFPGFSASLPFVVLVFAATVLVTAPTVRWVHAYRRVPAPVHRS